MSAAPDSLVAVRSQENAVVLADAAIFVSAERDSEILRLLELIKAKGIPVHIIGGRKTPPKAKRVVEKTDNPLARSRLPLFGRGSVVRWAGFNDFPTASPLGRDPISTPRVARMADSHRRRGPGLVYSPILSLTDQKGPPMLVMRAGVPKARIDELAFSPDGTGLFAPALLAGLGHWPTLSRGEVRHALAAGEGREAAKTSALHQGWSPTSLGRALECLNRPRKGRIA